MKGRGDRQAGFSIIEAVVVVAVIGIIGAGGWFVYQHNRTKLTGATGGTQTTNQGTNQQTTTTNQNVVQVPELGIQITVPDSIKDLTYKIETLTLRDGSQSPTAFFSTSSLAAADPNCGPSAAPLGTLGRSDGKYPTQSEDPTNVLDYGHLVKQFPTFYIAAGVPNGGGCSTLASAGSAAAATTNNAHAAGDKTAFSNSLSTIQPLN